MDDEAEIGISPHSAGALEATTKHFVSGRPIMPPFPSGTQRALFGMGCFWGAEQRFWELPGVYCTAVGYAGGRTTDPTYREVCAGNTGHTEVVLVVFDPTAVTLSELLKRFWESHDPTQGMRQGNDIGSQYRSAIYVADQQQRQTAEHSRAAYQKSLHNAGMTAAITTEIAVGRRFFYAEDYHQQYLAKNPNGYCGLGGTGIRFVDSDTAELQR